jgi:acetylornithine/succinyldiaminopimelate/putrescine aminotransferase
LSPQSTTGCGRSLDVARTTARWLNGQANVFCNSGAEANEAAVKLAKRYQMTVKGKPERSVQEDQARFGGSQRRRSS